MNLVFCISRVSLFVNNQSLILFSSLFNSLLHYIDATWALCRFKSPANRVFVQQLVKASDIKENNKVHITGPLWADFLSGFLSCVV